MSSDFAFIPGFRAALLRLPDARESRDILSAMAARGTMGDRARAMIALAIAQQSGFDYCAWAQACVARSAGLSGEDIAFACAGTALDRRDAARVRLAREIVRQGRFSSEEVRAMPHDPVLTHAEMFEVATCAGSAVIDNYILESLAPVVARAGETGRN